MIVKQFCFGPGNELLSGVFIPFGYYSLGSHVFRGSSLECLASVTLSKNHAHVKVGTKDVWPLFSFKRGTDWSSMSVGTIWPRPPAALSSFCLPLLVSVAGPHRERPARNGRKPLCKLRVVPLCTGTFMLQMRTTLRATVMK